MAGDADKLIQHRILIAPGLPGCLFGFENRIAVGIMGIGKLLVFRQAIGGVVDVEGRYIGGNAGVFR